MREDRRVREGDADSGDEPGARASTTWFRRWKSAPKGEAVIEAERLAAIVRESGDDVLVLEVEGYHL